MRAKITTKYVRTLTPQTKAFEVYDTELTGFFIRIQPSGHKSYYLFYRTPDGRKRQYRIGPADRLTVAQARDLAQHYAARTVVGEDIQSTKEVQRKEAQHAKLRTLQGFLDHQYAPWLYAERPEKRRSAEVIQRLRTNFTALLEHPLADISPWVIEKWRAEQRTHGKTPAAINRDLTTLRSVLSKAVTWGFLDEHPLAPLSPLKVDPHPRVRYLSTEEEQRLRTALDSRDARIQAARNRGNAWRQERGYAAFPTLDQQTYGDHLTPMVLLTLNTGLRRGELFNLSWKDVDVNTKTLTVEGSTAKSGHTRHIPLNPEASDVLEAWYRQRPGDHFIFPGKEGGRLNNVKKAWSGALRQANITAFRWHDLRHDFASKLVMAGVPLNTVRDLLGHTTLNTTLRYAHLAPDHKAEAVNRLRRPSTASRSLKTPPLPTP